MIRKTYYFICGAVLFFMMAPILICIPLSFNAQRYLTFTPGMLALHRDAFSLRWYASFFGSEVWRDAIVNSMIVGSLTTLVATTLGTVAAIGLSRQDTPFRKVLLALILSPMIVPVIVTAAGIYFLFSRWGLTQSITGLVIAHTIVAVPLVVITVSAALSRFDYDLVKASLSLSASPIETFFRVTLPLIAPGVASGAIFAFATSLDEVVMALFIAGVDQRTIPLIMWSGIREELSPTILAAAVILTMFSICMLLTVEYLRAWSSKFSNA
ncbi:ABC transporter permease [Burkholderia sp. Ac-20344]|uniref:ABC transporter permease n=1 Tax=Burkholderia sp. Ac-20344 TaxID=2703890 RepID=UPI00197B71E2|nr:ABC transporter permease [Burkholderia sp. Ac-20344]MBN3830357.1 ABC transporter permease [Burkholderia sp. Ac-20344]